MCGITLCVKGSDFSKLHFFFDLFQLYRENPFNNFALSNSYQDFHSYMIENNLYINDFSPQDILQSIQDRGPDFFSCYKIIIPISTSDSIKIEEIKQNSAIFSSNIFYDEKDQTNNQDCLEIYAACSVLHLRGMSEKPTPQPLFSPDTNNFILYNGEIFNVEERYFHQYAQKENNYQEILTMLNHFNPFENDTKQLLDILNQYSKIYKARKEEGKEPNYQGDIKEIINCLNADFAFIYVDLLNRKIIFGKDIFGKRGLVWGFKPNGFCLSSCSINTSATEADFQDEQNADEEEGKKETERSKEEMENEKNHSGLLKQHLKDSFLEKKYNNEYFMALEKTWIEVPSNRMISIALNTIENPNPKFSLSMKETSLSYFENIFSLKKNDFKEFEDDVKIASEKTCEYLKNSLTNIVKNIIPYKPFFENHIMESVNMEEHKEDQNKKEENAALAILFSGGLDSTLLALLCSQILPEHTHKDAPDRETAIQAYIEIKKINPKANLKLILIDKSLDDADKQESKIIKLIYPKLTHMDYNIGAALHLASKGEGILFQEKETEKITFIKSNARVILSGLGADEIFGGYSRYRVAFLRGGYEELHWEMNFDLNRLWIRNLGRDDRCISSNSKEVRFPFLNRELVEYVATIKPEILTNFAMPRGSGDKVLLRNVAKNLGLEISHNFKKRAIQFGTKLAKLSNIKMFGSNRKARGTALYKKK